MTRSFGASALFCIVLCASTACSHALKSILETQFEFMLKQRESAGAGAMLDDRHMEHLTESIKGWFDDGHSGRALEASKVAQSEHAPETSKVQHVVPQKAAHVLAQRSDAATLLLQQPQKAVAAAMRKPTIATKPGDKAHPTKPVGAKKQRLVESQSPAPPKRQVPKLASNAQNEITAKIVEASKLVEKAHHASKSVPKAHHEKGARTSRISPVVKSRVGEKPKAAPKSEIIKLPKVLNLSADLSNGTQETENATKAAPSTPKVIEEAVPSLPMASFALDDEPKTNQTEKPKVVPGNATKRAAWEKREKALEAEVATLKARLAKVVSPNKSSAPSATGTFNSHPNGNTLAIPKLADGKVSKFMAAREPEPMQPIRKDLKPKATWPTMQSVAAPVKEQQAVKASPPPKKVIAVKGGAKQNLTMATAFTGFPVKKMDSVLAIDAAVGVEAQEKPEKSERVMALDSVSQHVAEVIENSDDEESAAAPTVSSVANAAVIESSNDDVNAPVLSTVNDAAAVNAPVLSTGNDAAAVQATSSMWSWVSSLFSWVFYWPSSAAVSEQPTVAVAPQVPAPAVHFQRDPERTAQATREESRHVVTLNDAFGQLENEDQVEEERVRREDVADRQRAESQEKPRLPTQAEIQSRGGTHMSGFWSQLEKEDSQITDSLNKEDYAKYERMTETQNDRVAHAAEKSRRPAERVTSLRHRDDALVAIHEPWLKLEKKDKLQERKIHENPNLQMLQLSNWHRFGK